MHNILENIWFYLTCLLFLTGLIVFFLKPFMKKRVTLGMAKLLNYIAENGYLNQQKVMQEWLVMNIVADKFKTRAKHYTTLCVVIRKNLREIVQKRVFTKVEIRYILSFRRATIPLTIALVAILLLLLICWLLLKWY